MNKDLYGKELYLAILIEVMRQVGDIPMVIHYGRHPQIGDGPFAAIRIGDAMTATTRWNSHGQIGVKRLQVASWDRDSNSTIRLLPGVAFIGGVRATIGGIKVIKAPASLTEVALAVAAVLALGGRG